VCGILGIVSARPRFETDVPDLLSLLGHRGPDGEGVRYSDGGPPFVCFGHRRLAIIDLSEDAAQPMLDESGRFWLTFNGEIYNYRELRQELEAKGWRFRSRSDTEVLLHAYQEFGPGCLDRLNGMFAFAIWDAERRELFAARDRFGEKPFHYAWLPERGLFGFSSEIKALLPLPWVDGGLDDRALYRFVAFRELAGSAETLFRGVRRLPNAHWLRLSWKGSQLELSVRRYWDIDLADTASLDLDEAARRFRDLFSDSVRLRLRADVPVGTSLSGGLDSSAVVCQIHRLGAAAGQKAFSARMEEAALDEGPHIARVLKHTAVAGHEVWPRAEQLQTMFERLCYHQEEPFLSTSQYAQHLVMQLARENGVTVLLDGQGADELLAGYTRYFRLRYADLAAHRRVGVLALERLFFSRHHGRDFPLSPRLLMALLWRGASNSGVSRSARTPTWKEMLSWWSEEWLASFPSERGPERYHRGRDALTSELYNDALGGGLQELLRYGDRNSMASSRELRQPFLDHRLAELAFALPATFKLHRGETKLVMRRAFADLLPPALLARQDKLGYQAPLRSWIAGPLNGWARQMLEAARETLGRRLKGDSAERVSSVSPTWTEGDCSALFAILTLGEAHRTLRAIPRRVAATA
jgi:asparagine synthase (glutamine-hydrolysing)